MELVIKNLGKQFNESWAVQDFSLNGRNGMIGLVGPNGAGKTTLMRMVSALIPPTTGTIHWGGKDVLKDSYALRKELGYLPQDFGVFPELTGRQFLRYIGAMKEIPKDMLHRGVDEVLEQVNLESVREKKLSTYSGGMKQRIGIAQALLNNPKLLIVDEPTVGLDPAERVHFRTLLSKLTADRLVILSTHIIGDIESVASRIVVMQKGRLLFDNTQENLNHIAQGKVWSVTVSSHEAERIQATCQVSGLITNKDAITIRIISDSKPHPLATLIDPTLEDAYLLLVK